MKINFPLDIKWQINYFSNAHIMTVINHFREFIRQCVSFSAYIESRVFWPKDLFNDSSFKWPVSFPRFSRSHYFPWKSFLGTTTYSDKQMPRSFNHVGGIRSRLPLQGLIKFNDSVLIDRGGAFNFKPPGGKDQRSAPRLTRLDSTTSF